MTVIRIIDEIWDNSENVDSEIQKLTKGRYFFISLQRDMKKINTLASKERILQDKNNLVSGERLFPLTLRLWNWEDRVPGDTISLPILGGLELLRLYYFGMSPELENFAVLVLWPENSKHSFEALKQIYSAVEVNKQPILYMEGDYRMKLPNEIHPYRFSRITTKFDVKTLEWKYVPWLKDIGDTLFEHRSPANYRKVYLDIKGIKYAYINPRVGIGIIKDLLKSTCEIRLKLPYLNRSAKRKYLLAKVLLDDKLNDLRPGDIVFFMLLEVVHNKGSFIPERYIYYITKADFIDILAHLSAFVLYNLYLDKYGLYIMSVPEFQKLYARILVLASMYCKSCNLDRGLVDWELLFSSYLEPFFKVINHRVYYVPYLLTHNEYLKKQFDINMDLKMIIQKIDALLLETRESRSNFSKINLLKTMKELDINSASKLRSLLELSSKVALIKRLNRLIRGSIWRMM